MVPGRHIAVSGIVGAGKTTLVRNLSKELGYLGLEERSEDNPYLAAFYRDPAVWAFKSYAFFFQRTLEDHISAQNAAFGAIQERTLDEHLLVFGEEYYAREYFSNTDIELLRSLTTCTSALLPKPDLLLHVDVKPDEALVRLRHRGNPIESGIELEYLTSLSKRYERMLAKWEGNILRVDGTGDDFRDQVLVATLARDIREILG